MTQASPMLPPPGADNYQTIRFTLKHGTKIRFAAALAVTGAIGWVGMRTGLPELWLIGAGAGITINFIGKVALEVLALVADTLVPQ
jgi:hypothetical protein